MRMIRFGGRLPMILYGNNKQLTSVVEVTNYLESLGCVYECKKDYLPMIMDPKDPDTDFHLDYYFKIKTKKGNNILVTIGDDGSIYTTVADSPDNPIIDLPIVTDSYGNKKRKYQLMNNYHPKDFPVLNKDISEDINSGKRVLYRHVYKSSKNDDYIKNWKRDFDIFYNKL